MSSLEHSGLQGEAWAEDDRLHFLSVARAFLDFQRSHMRFENTEVFPRAERVLSEMAFARLSRDVERFAAAAGSRIARATELAEILKRRYLLNDSSLCQGADRVDRHFARSR